MPKREIDLADRLPFLTKDRVAELNSLLADPHDVTASEIATALGIDEPDAVSVMAVLASENTGTYGFLVYHTCDASTPADFWPSSEGFPRLPWTCELCENKVVHPEEMLIENAFEMEDPIRVIAGGALV